MLVICLMWIVTIALMFGTLYVIGNVGFWIFAQAFGIVDQYLQDRQWKRKGYGRVTADDGKDWYVSGYYVDGHNWGDE